MPAREISGLFYLGRLGGEKQLNCGFQIGEDFISPRRRKERKGNPMKITSTKKNIGMCLREGQRVFFFLL